MINIGPLIVGEFVKRPSARCKTPYVADVLLEGGDREVLAHSPSLGCCGLVDRGTRCKMLLRKLDPATCKTCTHRIEFVELPDTTVLLCVNPKVSEELTEAAFINDAFPEHVLGNLNGSKALSREVSFQVHEHEKSRFDFAGVDAAGSRFVLEVKSVPLVGEDGVSYFPDGYRRKKGDVVSPRALKHIQHLEAMVAKGYDAYLVFCVQRGDSKGFRVSEGDPVYRDAVHKARNNGVKILVLYFHWALVDGFAHCLLERVQVYGAE